MPVRSERLSVNPRLRYSIDGLRLGKTAVSWSMEVSLLASDASVAYSQHLADHSGTCNLDEDDMIQPDTIVRVEQGETSLDLVRLDHCFQHVFDSYVLALAAEMVRNGEDGTQIIGRVTPFRREPAVVEVCYFR